MEELDRKKKIYWGLQISGWFVWSLVLGFWNYYYLDLPFYPTATITLLLFFCGIALTHFFRNLMLEWNWLKMSVFKLIPRVLLASALFSILNSLIVGSFSDYFLNDLLKKILVWPPASLIGLISYFFTLYLLWSSIYLTYHFLVNYEKEEVKNLRLSAANREQELNNLKNQLNPHFMFNALNSIRALIDEDPQLAEDSLTRFSSLLRNTLIAGKRELITLEDEMSVVQNYLALEAIRYEERLKSNIEIPKENLHNKIPPFLIQTLVENGIKHGISKLPEGGMINIKVSEPSITQLKIRVENDGYFDEDAVPDTGIGLSNSRKRLELLFGKMASLQIRNEHRKVVAIVELPKILNL
ncbi:MAG: histidine kinase [Bacteroidota bacterium]